MDHITKRRESSVTITSSASAKLLGNKYVFDCDGNLLSDFGNITPPWLIEKFRELILSNPHVTGRETLEVNFPDCPGGSVTALLERYIDITLGGILESNAEVCGQREAVVDATTGERLDYRTLKAESDRMAKILIDLGVRKGETVAIVMLNSASQLVSKCGIYKIGAVIVNISPFEKENGLRMLLSQTDATTLIMKPGVKGEEIADYIYSVCPELETSAPGELRSKALPKLRRVIIECGGGRHYPGMLRFETLMRSEPKCTDMQLYERTGQASFKDVASIIHTSGTTSTPKSVMLRHGAIIENAWAHVEMIGIPEGSRVFTPTPMFHALSSIGTCITAFVSRSTLCCLSKPNPKDVLDMLAREKITVMFSVPTFYIMLLDEIRASGFDTSALSLQTCVLAGSDCSRELIRMTRDVMRAEQVLVMYGLTEAGPGVSSTRADDTDEVKASTVGKPWPGVSVKLSEPMEVGNVTAGEICVRGYNVMKGYYKDHLATSKAIDEEGWLHTGDLGRVWEDGSLTIVGRLKDIIIRNGENISPREIEAALAAHPSVSEARAVGARDIKCGETIYAFVKRSGSSAIDESELIGHCRGSLASIKVPSRIYAIDDFPKSDNGKILMKELRAMAQKIHDSEKGDGEDGNNNSA
jgi:fatty-acyl-CoA synthase